jgi:predicted small lipoprotein YifL
MKVANPVAKLYVILLAFLFVSLSSCGMQGDLYLPDSEDPNTSVKIKNP